MTSPSAPFSSTAKARRSSALASALGPILSFLADERVVEVMLNADGVVWVEKQGEGVFPTDARMASTDAERMLRLVAAEILVELNAQHPSLSAKLPAPWSARLQAAIPPIVDAPVFALRKPARFVFSLDDYVKSHTLSARQGDALAHAVHARDNILIGGGTGSGKTTFANALLKVIAEDTTDRVHIIEDTPELQCEAPNKVQVLVQPACTPGATPSWRRCVFGPTAFWSAKCATARRSSS
jgi:Flp pilus assembly CpaF family ATPase